MHLCRHDRMSPSSLIRNATILTMNDALDIVEGDVLVRDGRIAAVGADRTAVSGSRDRRRRRLPPAGLRADARPSVPDALSIGSPTTCRCSSGCGAASGRSKRRTRRRRCAPSTRLAAAELLLSGTTTALTMETVHDTDVVFETLAACGLRATVGKCMMDADGEVPGAAARADPRDSIDESLALQRALARRGRTAGCAPRSRRGSRCPARASCSKRSPRLVRAARRARAHARVGIARRSRGRAAAVGRPAQPGVPGATPGWRRRGCARRTASGSTDAEQALIAERDVKVLHCPGSNLKLGSGIAPVAEMRARGISVSLGADGAACNNRLDMFDEMRLAATLQAVRRGPGALPARDVLWMATREGARTLGLEDEIGSIETGQARRPDRRRSRPARTSQPDRDPVVHARLRRRGTDVRLTMVDGEVLVERLRADARRRAARSPPTPERLPSSWPIARACGLALSGPRSKPLSSCCGVFPYNR